MKTDEYRIHSAAGMILTSCGHYVMQQREDKPHVSLPGYVGFFGGGIEPGEDAWQALKREMMEELELDIETYETTFFTRLTWDLQTHDLGLRARDIFLIRMDEEEAIALPVLEGKGKLLMTAQQVLDGQRIISMDQFSVLLHEKYIKP